MCDVNFTTHKHLDIVKPFSWHVPEFVVSYRSIFFFLFGIECVDDDDDNNKIAIKLDINYYYVIYFLLDNGVQL